MPQRPDLVSNGSVPGIRAPDDPDVSYRAARLLFFKIQPTKALLRTRTTAPKRYHFVVGVGVCTSRIGAAEAEKQQDHLEVYFRARSSCDCRSAFFQWCKTTHNHPILDGMPLQRTSEGRLKPYAPPTSSRHYTPPAPVAAPRLIRKYVGQKPTFKVHVPAPPAIHGFPVPVKGAHRCTKFARPPPGLSAIAAANSPVPRARMVLMVVACSPLRPTPLVTQLGLPRRQTLRRAARFRSTAATASSSAAVKQPAAASASGGPYHVLSDGEVFGPSQWQELRSSLCKSPTRCPPPHLSKSQGVLLHLTSIRVRVLSDTLTLKYDAFLLKNDATRLAIDGFRKQDASPRRARALCRGPLAAARNFRPTNSTISRSTGADARFVRTGASIHAMLADAIGAADTREAKLDASTNAAQDNDEWEDVHTLLATSLAAVECALVAHVLCSDHTRAFPIAAILVQNVSAGQHAIIQLTPAPTASSWRRGSKSWAQLLADVFATRTGRRRPHTTVSPIPAIPRTTANRPPHAVDFDAANLPKSGGGQAVHGAFFTLPELEEEAYQYVEWNVRYGLCGARAENARTWDGNKVTRESVWQWLVSLRLVGQDVPVVNWKA
ncbi:hypothetical protein C8R43DRAFT_946373 [Mycena crocata]|nr:hypothetical protein C8R43DRAFT_946373 [Mycena crocata]